MVSADMTRRDAERPHSPDPPVAGPVHSTYDWETTTPTVAIIETLASLDDGPPFDRPTRDDTLSDYVDTDALNRFLEHAPSETNTVHLEIGPYSLTLDGAGNVTLERDDATSR
jgi:hypothetical protein